MGKALKRLSSVVLPELAAAASMLLLQPLREDKTVTKDVLGQYE